jgi:3D (Asp-Asp-Asp) domain-containing protein
MGFFLLPSASFAVSAPAPVLPSYPVTITAYNAVPSQTDGNPFETASGAYSNPEVVAARSRDLAEQLPFGTIIEIDAPTEAGNSCGFKTVEPIIGYRVIADTMNARFTNYIDILFSTKSNYTRTNGTTRNASSMLGVCTGATVRVVGFVDITRPSNLPKTQDDLVALVMRGGSDLAFNK